MPTSKKTIAYLTDQLASLHTVSTKRMFGEYCLYFDGVPIAFICSDQLFIKPTKTNKQLLINEALKIQNQLDAHSAINNIVEHKEAIIDKINSKYPKALLLIPHLLSHNYKMKYYLDHHLLYYKNMPRYYLHLHQL